MAKFNESFNDNLKLKRTFLLGILADDMLLKVGPLGESWASLRKHRCSSLSFFISHKFDVAVLSLSVRSGMNNKPMFAVFFLIDGIFFEFIFPR